MTGIYGSKIGMTQTYGEDGSVQPVTLVRIKENAIVRVKTEDRDGYNALVVGLDQCKETKLSKSEKGLFAKNQKPFYRHVLEIRNGEAPSEQSSIDMNQFSAGEFVDVTGISKGKGFAGVIKRHGFKGGRKTHGSTTFRRPGSIGQCAWPSRVFKGKKLPGRLGHSRVTVENLKLVAVDSKSHTFHIKGALPGTKGTLVFIRKALKK